MRGQWKKERRIVLLMGGTIIVLCIALLAITAYIATLPQGFSPEYDSALIPADLSAPRSPFLETEEVVIIPPEATSGEAVVLPVQKVLFEYVEVKDSCGSHYQGECVNLRSGPGTSSPRVAQLRNGMVLKVGGKVEHDGATWYKIVYDEWLRFPDRAGGDHYVFADYVTVQLDEGVRTVWENGAASTSKKIIVDRSDQKLYAYEDGTLYMEVPISTGLELTPTPRGIFTVFKKTPSRYMQGPIPDISDQYYDLPGVPWNLYFTSEGAVIHGAYWHENFGEPWSHGCVNLPPEMAKKLYFWAELGMRVTVRD